jgi:hypothetical protein
MDRTSSKLFDYFLIVALKEDQTTPIEYRYPEGNAHKGDEPLIKSVPDFCFPDKERLITSKKTKDQRFTFVVTNIEGKKRYGYCLREIQKNRKLCYCLLSYEAGGLFFNKILDVTAELAARDQIGRELLQSLLSQLVSREFPVSGRPLTLTVSEQSYAFERQEDDESQLFGFVDFEPLLTRLDPFSIVTLILALLSERRVIFVSEKLSVLSHCAQGALALLYPFAWQHVFIPVLPPSMLTFCCAPVPFVVGILDTYVEELNDMPMEEFIMVDLDNNRIYPPRTDYELLTPSICDSLLQSIQLARDLLLDSKKGKDATKPELNALEQGALTFYVDIMASYKRYLKDDKFNTEEFVNHNAQTKQFMEIFVTSQMFEMFIEERTPRSGRADNANKFEKRLTQAAFNLDLTAPSGLKRRLIFKEGYLTKLGGKSKQKGWQDRYFILDSTTLSYYRSKNDVDAAGVIPLYTVTSCKLTTYKDRENCLEIHTEGRVYWAYAALSVDSVTWYNILNHRVNIEAAKARGVTYQPTPRRSSSRRSFAQQIEHTFFSLTSQASQFVKSRFSRSPTRDSVSNTEHAASPSSGASPALSSSPPTLGYGRMMDQGDAADDPENRRLMQEFYQQLREKIMQRQNRQVAAPAPRPHRPSWDDSVLNSSSKHSATSVRQSTSTGTLRKSTGKNKYGTVSPSMGRQLSSVLAQQIKDGAHSPPHNAGDSLAQWKHVNVYHSGASPPSSYTNMYTRANTGPSLVKNPTLQSSSSGPSSGYSTAPSSGYSTPSSGPNSGSLTVAHVKRSTPASAHSKVAAYVTIREPVQLHSSYGSEFTARRTDPGLAPPTPPPRTPSSTTITVTANKTTANKQQAVRVVQQRAPPTIVSSSTRPLPDPRPRSQSIPLYDNVDANTKSPRIAGTARTATVSPSSSPTGPRIIPSSSPVPVPRTVTVVQNAPRVPSPPQMIKITASTNKYKQPPPPLPDTTSVPAPPPRKTPVKALSDNSPDRRSTLPDHNPYVYNNNSHNNNHKNNIPNNNQYPNNNATKNNSDVNGYSTSPSNGTRALPPIPKQPQSLYPPNRY